MQPVLFEHHRLVFLCAYNGRPVVCGSDGKGYKIKKDSKLLKTIRPIVKLTLMLLRGVTAVSGLMTSDEFAQASRSLGPSVTHHTKILMYTLSLWLTFEMFV